MAGNSSPGSWLTLSPAFPPQDCQSWTFRFWDVFLNHERDSDTLLSTSLACDSFAGSPYQSRRGVHGADFAAASSSLPLGIPRMSDEGYDPLQCSQFAPRWEEPDQTDTAACHGLWALQVIRELVSKVKLKRKNNGRHLFLTHITHMNNWKLHCRDTNC